LRWQIKLCDRQDKNNMSPHQSGGRHNCLIRVLLYRRNVYNFVKRHSELIAIFLKN
jgi:hypothetical protein